MKWLYRCQCCGTVHLFDFQPRQNNAPIPARITSECRVCTLSCGGGVKDWLPLSPDQQPTAVPVTTYLYRFQCEHCRTIGEIATQSAEVPWLPTCPKCGALQPAPQPGHPCYLAHRRLLFARWLARTGRINEGLPDGA